jgi:putative endonuclease
MSNKAKLGVRGESIAAQYLENLGYRIEETNYRYKHSEIDLIVMYDQMLIFVEVKTRSKIAFGYPEEAVDEKKSKKIIEGAEYYIFENDWGGDIRFDIVSIIASEKMEITHFKDAF